MSSLKQDMGAVSSDTYSPSMIVSEQLNGLLANLLETTFKAFAEPASQLYRESCLLTLVRAVLHSHADDPPPERRLGKEHNAVGLLKNYLREHVADDVTLADLSALTGLSKDHLIRVFNRDVGLTPHVYQTNLRVTEAKKLLAKGVSIAETALLTGFSDQSHLHHTFKKYVLVTPGAYQQACVPRKVLTPAKSQFYCLRRKPLLKGGSFVPSKKSIFKVSYRTRQALPPYHSHIGTPTAQPILRP